MSNDKTYNGWSTYETWLVHLWLDNDGVLEALRGDLMACDTLFDAKTLLKDYVEQQMEIEQMPMQGMFSDLLRSALNEVNWYEIARNVTGAEADQ